MMKVRASLHLEGLVQSRHAPKIWLESLQLVEGGNNNNLKSMETLASCKFFVLFLKTPGVRKELEGHDYREHLSSLAREDRNLPRCMTKVAYL